MSIELTSTSNSVSNVDQKESNVANPVVFWTLALVAQMPLLALYLIWIWRFEHYQYFPFLLLAVGGLAWSRVTRPIQYPTGKLSIAFFVASMAILFIGCAINSAWFASVSFFLLVASFMIAHGMFYLCIPLLLLIRLPLNYDVLIITSLQSLTTRLSSFVLDLASVPHLARGNVIELADRELFVAEACSGVQSAFTIAFIALLIAAWHRRPLILIPAYLAIAIVWAVLCNTLRVTVIAFAAANSQIDLSSGFAHEAIGYGTLVLAGLLTLSTDSLLAVLFHTIGDESEDVSNGFVSVWEWLFGTSTAESIPNGSHELATDAPVHHRRWALPMVISLGLVSIFSLTAHAFFRANLNVVNAEGKVLIDPSPTLLDHLTGPVTYRFSESMRGGKDARLGMNADQWAMQYGNLAGTLVFSQPYPEWHELSVCYSGQGWELVSFSFLQTKSRADGSKKIKLAKLTRRDGAIGYLLYAGFNVDGSIITPPGDHTINKFVERCTQIFTGRDDRELSIYSGDCAMLQVWIVNDKELSGEALLELAGSITQARDVFSQALASANVRFPEAGQP